MSMSRFQDLAYKDGYEIPQRPKSIEGSFVYVYKHGQVVGKGLYKDLPGWLPKGMLTEKDPEGALEELMASDFVVELIKQEEAYKILLEDYERRLEAFRRKVYDFLCSPEFLGIVQNDVTDVLFRLSCAEHNNFIVSCDNYHFLPSVSSSFYKYCELLRSEMRALPGCIEDDFYKEHFFCVSFGYHDRKGFIHGQERFWEDLKFYDPSDHPELARRFIKKIMEFNQSFSPGNQSSDWVGIDPRLKTLAEKDESIKRRAKRKKKDM